MGATHTVRFEPVGIEIEVDESETILNAAFRQGIMLMHGCKEGQCSACKSFILDGEVELINYDEEIIHGGTPSRTVSTVVESVEALTSDIFGLKLRPAEPLAFKP